MDENKENLCSRCKSKIEESQDSACNRPHQKEYSTFGNIMFLVCCAFLIWFVGGCLKSCAEMHLGGGMCGLMGIEALLPLGALWLYRKLNRGKNV